MNRVTRTVFIVDDAEEVRSRRLRSSADFVPTSSLQIRPVVRQRPICPAHAPMPSTVADIARSFFRRKVVSEDVLGRVTKGYPSKDSWHHQGARRAARRTLPMLN